jgi:hypothetical protein
MEFISRFSDENIGENRMKYGKYPISDRPMMTGMIAQAG